MSISNYLLLELNSDIEEGIIKEIVKKRKR